MAAVLVAAAREVAVLVAAAREVAAIVEAATAAVRSLGLLVFFKFQEGIIHGVLSYQKNAKNVVFS